MTRKDYINIAGAILAAQARIRNDLMVSSTDDERSQLRGVRRAAAQLADFLADDNPRFDKARFLQACGYGGDVQRAAQALRIIGAHPGN